jgi:hypothetical protein
VSLPEVIPSSPVKGEQREESKTTMDEVIGDSMVFEPAEAAPAPGVSSGPVDGPSTPRRSTRLSQVQARETPTPKSEGEEFVDAPTSPLPPTPRQLEKAARDMQLPEVIQHVIPSNNTSFDGGEIDESGLLRLVVELDSGKADRSEYQQSSVSPGGKAQKSPVIDCIVVQESPKKGGQPAPSRVTRASSAASTMSFTTEHPAPPRITRASSAASTRSSSVEPQSMPSSQSKPCVGRPKRKRALSKAQEASPKRQRQDSVEESGEVADNQAAPAHDNMVEVHASGEMQQVIAADVTNNDVSEERIPSSSAEPSSSDSTNRESDSQDPGAHEVGDAMEVEEDDQDVQSQIALEFGHSQLQEDDSTPVSGENSPMPIYLEESFSPSLHPEESSPAPLSFQEPMHVDMQQRIPIPDEEGKEEAANDTEESITRVEEGAVGPDVTPELKQAQKIMELFRGGLDELRTARLSREEVYQIEDMFMDMKRELYEAERRGRA